MPPLDRVGYRDVAAELRHRISDGTYPAGAQLPSEGELAASFKVARGTAGHVYQVLEGEGLVRKVAGRGRFVMKPGASDADYIGRAPYLVLADELRSEIESGSLRPGEVLPTADELSRSHSVSTATSRRAVRQLKLWGLVDAGQGIRARVRSSGGTAARSDEEQGSS